MLKKDKGKQKEAEFGPNYKKDFKRNDYRQGRKYLAFTKNYFSRVHRLLMKPIKFKKYEVRYVFLS